MGRKAYQPKSMSNRDIKKAAAERHNDLYIEGQAYREDMARDTDKYKRPKRKRGRLKVMIAGLGAYHF